MSMTGQRMGTVAVLLLILSGCGDQSEPIDRETSTSSLPHDGVVVSLVPEVPVIEPEEEELRFVEAGDDQERVRSLMGAPRGRMQTRDQTVWIYDRGQVVFQGDKVVSTDLLPDDAFLAKVEAQKQRIEERRKAVEEARIRRKEQELIPADARDLTGEWVDNRTGDRLVMTVEFEVQRLSQAEKKKYEKKGVVPYRITTVVQATRPDVADKNRLLLLRSGNCWMRVIDENGKVVLDKNVSLAKMCPS